MADPVCLSRIPDPDFYPSRIPDLGSRIQKQQQKRGVKKKLVCHNFLCSNKFHKIAHYFSFDVLKKKSWANFQRIIELFSQKIVNMLSKIWIWDPGSEIRDPEKTYSGSRGQKGTGSWIRIRNTGGRYNLEPQKNKPHRRQCKMSSSKKFTCKGTLRQVIIFLRSRTPVPPLTCITV